MTTALMRIDPYLDILFAAQLLCLICQERPWTQHARWHDALVCADCASGEPNPNDEGA